MEKIVPKILNDGLTLLNVPVGTKVLSIKSIDKRATIFLQHTNSKEREVLEVFPFGNGSDIPESFLKDFTYIDTVSLDDYVVLHYYYRVFQKDMKDLFNIMTEKLEVPQNA